VDQLGVNDGVAIVVYAGAGGLVLPSTCGDNKQTFLDALARLQAGGSTNGGEGIRLAYQLAHDNFIPAGTNRVILCSDGDFNVGSTSTGELIRLVEEQAKQNVFLTVLGFGMGNHNDAMLEQISNRGNGNYAFIDTDAEARKVLVEQMSGTLVTIAKDVKIQVEFNPAQVAAYRLLGYENRLLAAEDFSDDQKDAGEIGAGHTVTALYEVVPVGVESDLAVRKVDPLRYQQQETLSETSASDEILTLKLRYKFPAASESTLLAFALTDGGQSFDAASTDFRFAASVASFGMLLRNSQHKGEASYDQVLEISRSALGDDPGGYRREFVRLVQRASELAP
ncbi:MAG: vWA domain-containing protein, partial [Pirellulaceae bacterium]